MSKFFTAPIYKLRRARGHVRIEGQVLSLSSSIPRAQRRNEKEESLVDSLTNNRKSYLFRYRRRRGDSEPI